jgi:hypothetical protein
MYLLANFLRAARRDIAHPATTVSLGALLGIRINDYWENMASDYDLDERSLFRKHKWAPPWPESWS